MTTTERLSSSGKVIIMSIHQPRYSIYKLFDSLTLMSRGRLVYHGPANRALPYFSDIGYQCEYHDNPADFYLDVVMENEKDSVPQDNDLDNAGPSENLSLAELFEKSREFRSLKQRLDIQLTEALNEPQGLSPEFTTGFFWQCGVLAVKTLRNLVRDKLTAGVQISMMLGTALLVGIIFLQTGDDFGGVQDRLGAMFFGIANAAFMNISAVGVFLKEKQLFVHQNISGYYRVSSYFLTKLCCDLIPIRVIPLILYVNILYWMVGLEPDAGKFFFHLLTMIVFVMAACSLAFTISAWSPVETLAIVGIAFTFFPQMMYMGFLKNLNEIDDWISWPKYLSIFRYALNAVVVTEIDGNKYPPGCPTNASILDCLDGSKYLDTLGYLEFDVWYNILALFCFNVGFLVLAYVSLRQLKKEK
ncbi:broad substrate specificity ATP-binding cassette transporter ABCG2-like [Dysidea avara]|uniref:broad substrate specificity ATP-binding cassette transporter ABCG2-like n=1 Tax=Dysidea avara TaxID=196820 RepID=UPI003321CB7C